MASGQDSQDRKRLSRSLTVLGLVDDDDDQLAAGRASLELSRPWRSVAPQEWVVASQMSPRHQQQLSPRLHQQQQQQQHLQSPRQQSYDEAIFFT